MKVSIIAFTDNGMLIADKLFNSLESVDLAVDGTNVDLSVDNSDDVDLAVDGSNNADLSLGNEKNELNVTRCKKGGLSDWTDSHFSSSDALVFVGAIGIAIRAIAPYVKTKTRDPAVVVVDELGRFSIPVLSGHIGGANRLAEEIANVLGAIPVITTATDINDVFAVDTWAKSQGLRILNPENIKLVSSKLLKGEEIHIKSDYPIGGKLPENVFLNDLDDVFNDDLESADNSINCLKTYDVVISHKDLCREFNDALFLIPSIITIGIGCRRDKDFKTIEESILNALSEENCHILSLRSISSIDVKKNEKGILEFADKYELPFRTYGADELNALEGDFTPSRFVKSVVKVDNVCERSAIADNGGKLFRRKDAHDGVTVALAIQDPGLNW